MDNWDVETARDYHESTKLTYINLRNKPPLYKSYQGLPEIHLHSDFASPEISTLEAVAGGAARDRSAIPPAPFGRAESEEIGSEQVESPDPAGPGSVDLSVVARLLYYSAGLIQKRVVRAAGEVHYRAAASAGALYPVEVYLVTGDIPGLEAGVYHFFPPDFSLRQLRKGDFRGELVAATAGDRDVAVAPITMVFTAVFWRSAWKYCARSYRYCCWDAGTMVANLLATLRSEGSLPGRLVAGFVDNRLNHLLGINPESEASLCLVPVGVSEEAPMGSISTVVKSLRVRSDLFFDEAASYPEISRIHAASCLNDEAEVSAWRRPEKSHPRSTPAPLVNSPSRGQSFSLDIQELQSSPLGETIRKRGSTRRFARAAIPFSEFAAVLDSSTGYIPADFREMDAGSLLDIYIIANAVEGLPSGAYYFSPAQRKLEPLKHGSFREEAGHLCFEQALGADASAILYLMGDLDRVLGRLGNRGYRAAQLEAGIVVGKAYLSAHSLGLGATGMTFYDDDATEFFSPHAAGKNLMVLVALGKVDDQNRVRPFRSRVGVLLDSLARGAGSGSASVEG